MRKRLKEEDWRREEPRILAFCLDLVKPKENHRISMKQLFDAYNTWLKHRGYDDSVLSVDGFGRLFPKSFPRQTLVIGGEVRRGIKGWEIEE